MNLKNFDKYKQVEKVWGREIWLTNTQAYCAKFLEIQPGFHCSLHCHKLKHETFFVLEGTAQIKVIYPNGYNEERVYIPGDHLALEPGTYHRFQSVNSSPVLLLEVSTQHSDSDVQRLVDSGPILSSNKDNPW